MGKLAERSEDMLQLLNEELHKCVTTHAPSSKLKKGVEHLKAEPGLYITVSGLSAQDRTTYEVRCLKGNIATFTLTSFPGCCGVLVSCYSQVHASFRDKGIGTVLCHIRMAAARRQHYGRMVATVSKANSAEATILDYLGWTPVGEFRNPKTGNLVTEWAVNL